MILFELNRPPKIVLFQIVGSRGSYRDSAAKLKAIDEEFKRISTHKAQPLVQIAPTLYVKSEKEGIVSGFSLEFGNA